MPCRQADNGVIIFVSAAEGWPCSPVRISAGSIRTMNLAVHYVWLAGSKKKKIIQEAVRRIFEFCHERSIQLRIAWIPRERKVLADALSKYHDGDDWMLKGKYFSILDKRWGRHIFDTFASATNKQCEQHNSRFWCPSSAGVNSLAYVWVGENNWVNQFPFCSDRKSPASHGGLQGSGDCRCPKREGGLCCVRAAVPPGHRVLSVCGVSTPTGRLMYSCQDLAQRTPLLWEHPSGLWLPCVWTSGNEVCEL